MSSSSNGFTNNNNETGNGMENNNECGYPAKNEQASEPTRLKRNLTLSHAVAVICGAVIGAGIFISPAGVVIKAGSGGLTVVLWVLAGIVSLIGALVYVELGVTYPTSGGCYAYLNTMYGPYVAFLFSWMMTTFGCPGGNAMKLLIFSNYILRSLYDGDPDASAVLLVALLAGSALVFLNTITVRWSARGQTLLSALSIVLLLVVIALGCWFAATGHIDGWNLSFQSSSLNVGDWTVAFFSATFAFTGYNAMNFLMEEMVDPIKNLPRAIIVSIILITICYVFTNVAYIAVLGVDDLMTSKVVSLDFARRTIPWLSLPFAIAIALINIGSFNVSTLYVSRLLYVGGREDVFPRIFGLVNIRFNTPLVATISSIFPIIVYCSFDLLFMLNNIMLIYWLFEFLVVAGLIYQRYKLPHINRPLQYPIILPISYAVFTFGLVLFSVVLEPTNTVIGLAIVLATGTPYYLLFVRRIIRLPSLQKRADKLLVMVQKLSYSVIEEKEIQDED